MKEFFKKNFVIILAFALPLSLIAGVALLAYIPQSSPDTSFNFLYSSCTEGGGSTDYYYYYCDDYLQDRYSVVGGKLVVNAIDSAQYLDEEELDFNEKNIENIRDINEVFTTRLFLHDTKRNESREITLEEAKTLSLNGLLTSPDGITFSRNYKERDSFFFLFNSNYEYGYLLTKGKNKSKLNLIDIGRKYTDNLQFIGWILPSNN